VAEERGERCEVQGSVIGHVGLSKTPRKSTRNIPGDSIQFYMMPPAKLPSLRVNYRLAVASSLLDNWATHRQAIAIPMKL
jgi:hypothetical protein